MFREEFVNLCAIENILLSKQYISILKNHCIANNSIDAKLYSNINSKFYFCMSIDIPLISILMSIYMENLLKITHNLNASK